MRAKVVEELLSARHRRQLAVERTPVALDGIEQTKPTRLERAQPFGILLEAVGPASAHIRPREADILHLERLEPTDHAVRWRLGASDACDCACQNKGLNAFHSEPIIP